MKVTIRGTTSDGLYGNKPQRERQQETKGHPGNPVLENDPPTFL